MVIRTSAALLAALALISCGSDPGPPQVTVEGALVSLPAVPGRSGAGYFTLTGNRDGIRLLEITSTKAGRIDLHETGMTPLGPVVLSAGEPLAFAPGGRHAMLHGLDPSLRPGARIPLAFTFEGAPAVTTEAEVRAPGDVHPAH